MQNYKDIVKAAKEKGVTVKGEYSKNSETFFITANNISWMRKVCGRTSRLWVGFHPEKGNFFGRKFAVALWCITPLYQPEKEQ